MASDSSDIDNAIIAKLGGDPELLALCPDNVYWDVAPPGSERFVIVSLVQALDVDTFEGRAFEDIIYNITARMLASAGGNVKAAAARIDALLADEPLVVTGYTWMTVYRESRLRATEVDDEDPAIRWLHRGGTYRVQMALTTG